MSNSKIPEGYKQTEIGVIPVDWNAKSLKDLCIEKGLVRGPFGGSLKKEFFVSKGAKVYEQKNAIYRNVELGEYFIDKDKFIELKRFEVKPHDFIVSCSGTIGKIYLIPENAPTGIINQALLKISTDDAVITKEYFYHYFSWEKFQEKIIDNTQGGAMKNLVGMSIFKETQLPIPLLLPEQSKIATALSDVDSLIEKLEKLIRKKKNIKKGAMQELLTGKRRLPGFSDKWNLKELGQVLKVRHGKNQKNVEVLNGKYPILATGGEIGRTDTYLYNKPSVLIGRKGTIDVPQYMDTPFWTVDTLFYTEIENDSDAKFLFYKFQLIDWYSYNEASGVPSLNAKTIEGIELHLPSTKFEQSTIASILSDMDTEIEKLESQLEKYKNIKQGMMQNLLTGKIRLI